MSDPVLAPLTIWLTDRSRFKTGTSRCARQRYLGNHFGPSGYGITPKAESLPLAAGKWVHEGVEGFARILLEDRLPTLPEVRSTISYVQRGYEDLCTERGYRGMLAGPQTDETILEQKVLISGLLWAVRLKFLPWFHDRYKMIEVENERLHFLDCTCGAGALGEAEHIARGCEGHALMIRTDMLAENRSGSGLAYFECKTTGWDSSAWAEQWETDYQLALGTLDLPEKYGKEVTELYIVGLNKGSRRKDKYDPSERKQQLSALCYGYRRPGNPPLATDDWLPTYEWVDADGVTRRASRAHKKTGVWTLADSDWPVWHAYRDQDPDMSAEEFWVRNLPSTILDKVCFVLGPMNRQDHQLQAVRRAMLAEEKRWQERLWKLYEASISVEAMDTPSVYASTWSNPAVQATLDDLFPQSWACRPFGREHQCEFVPICHRESGWQDPLSTGRYQLRRPHHQPELDQAIARGLLVKDAAEVEEEE